MIAEITGGKEMSKQLNGLEAKLDKTVKDLPFQLPEKSRKAIVEYMPWITLFIGVLSLWAAYALWNLARVAERFIDLSNSLSKIYGGENIARGNLTLAVWLGVALLAIEGVLYLLAFPALKAKKKAGWNLLFYGALLNLVHGVVMLFNDYGGVGRLFSTLLGSAVGLYFLFQIRSHYSAAKK